MAGILYKSTENLKEIEKINPEGGTGSTKGHLMLILIFTMVWFHYKAAIFEQMRE